MKVLKSKILVVLALVFALCLTVVSATMINTAKADEVAPPTLTMLDGASVRVAEEDKVNGLRFAAGMSASDYGWFSENVGAGKAYKDVQFGMFIAPTDYLAKADFTEANLFGNEAYDWAEWNNDTQEWEYDETSSLVRIINIKKSTLKEYKGDMVIFGAISGYEEWNIVREFTGLGYYQLTDNDDKVTNYLAKYYEEDKANNSRSMIEVVQTAMEDGTLVPEQVDAAKETYFDVIADNVSVETKVNVVGNTTVAGNAYDGAMNSVDISNAVYTYNGKSITFKLNDWSSTSVGMATVNNGIVKGVKMASDVKINAKYMNKTVSVDVYTPISRRADLDALGFDYLDDQSADKWAYGNRYMLTNDIDYATDTSVYNSAEKGNMRMDDGNDTVDMWDRYLIPIAATQRNINSNLTYNDGTDGTSEWGIFGKIGADGNFFSGIIDGAGFAIKNAVIPYGVSFSYALTTTGYMGNHASNFIGSLVYGGQLRNIAFTGLEFEDYTQIGAASITENPNPYYTAANTNVKADSTLATKGYITTSSFDSLWGAKFFNASNLTGIVGSMQNGIISNVYVEAVMKNGTYGTRAINGLVVALIDNDYVEGGAPYRVGSKVENCITKTSYYAKASWVDWLVNHIGMSWAGLYTYNSGMGAVVGTSFLSDANAINNCFAIADLKVRSDDNGAIYDPVTTIFSPGTAGRHSSVVGLDKSTNCRLYADASVLQTEQASALANMSIAKYIAG